MTDSTLGWRAGSDIGGTFTDVAEIDADGFLHTAKVPSTPENYGHGVIEGLTGLAQRRNLTLADLSEMAHGCTVATNAILEGKGAKTALITTAGFRDVLELRRIRVPRLYEPLYRKPPPLVPRDLRFEIRERLDAEGRVVTPLETDDVLAVADRIAGLQVEAVAVCFLHAYLNPDHERLAGELLRQRLPGVFVTLSTEVLPQIREYERTSTTVINGYVGPPVRRYLQAMRDDLGAAGCPARIMVMQSSGGTVEAAAALAKPAQIVECGPAAGVVGAARLCRALDIDSAITFDMGGTTAKASLIEDGEMIFAEHYEVGAAMSSAGGIVGGAGYALKLPVLDISEVGAGGGSIVRLDRAGAIRVGPDSAGAVPGPACYGAGGVRATVTDANVALGFLNQTGLAGGTVAIEAGRAIAAVSADIADPLRLAPDQAAHGIHQVANATMVRAIKAVTTYRGRDPRDFAMIAFGGSGGVHAAGIAQSLELRRVIVPPAAGVFSAGGLLLADRAVTVAGACPGLLTTIEAATVTGEFARLRRQASQLIGCDEARAEFRHYAEMRYLGQAFELTIPVDDAGFADSHRADLRRRFDDEHARRFGHKFDSKNQVELVAVAVRARDSVGQAGTLPKPRRQSSPISHRQVYFGAEFGSLPTGVVDRNGLDDVPRQGPLIVEEFEGTTVVPPDARVHRDAHGNIVIDLETS